MLSVSSQLSSAGRSCRSPCFLPKSCVLKAPQSCIFQGIYRRAGQGAKAFLCSTMPSLAFLGRQSWTDFIYLFEVIYSPPSLPTELAHNSSCCWWSFRMLKSPESFCKKQGGVWEGEMKGGWEGGIRGRGFPSKALGGINWHPS